jgi:nucleoside-diphosphate-sugar epimerase
MAHVLIVGAGYVGQALAAELTAAGATVTAVRRRWEPGTPPLDAGGRLRRVAADAFDPAQLAALPWRDVDHIVYAVAAGHFDESAYRRAYVDGLGTVVDHARRAQGMRRFVLVSSTGVFGVGRGEWTDEESPVAAAGPFSARLLLEGEALLAASGLPGVAVRLGGIYGPARQSLLDSVRQGTARLMPPGSPPQWTNRIHRDDAAALIAHLALHPAPRALYLGVDDEPACKDDVLRWLASELGLPEPPVLGPDEAAAAAPQRGNRRCRNDRLKADGYRFKYPTYREGFGALLRSTP